MFPIGVMKCCEFDFHLLCLAQCWPSELHLQMQRLVIADSRVISIINSVAFLTTTTPNTVILNTAVHVVQRAAVIGAAVTTMDNLVISLDTT